MSEIKRGCGYRRINGLYLVCAPGKSLFCDALPFPLEKCGCCGFAPAFSRNLQRMNAQYVIQAAKKQHKQIFTDARGPEPVQISECKCPPECPLCHSPPEAIYGLMFVGKEYTPSSFIKEAVALGVSKRIPEIPKWLQLGKTWVFLAHNEVPDVSLEKLKDSTLLEKEPETSRAIFYGFKPERIEMPVWKGSLTNDEILLLEAHGVTPVFLDDTPENRKLHKDAKTNMTKSLLSRWTAEAKENKEEKT